MISTFEELKKILPKIRNCEFFIHLSPDELISLFEGIKISINKLSKGQLYAQRGMLIESLMILVEGELSADILNVEGQILKVETLQAPTLIASGLVFADQNNLPVQLTALTDATIMKIPRRELLVLAGKDTRILENLLTDSGNRIHFLAEKIRFMQIATIEKKICTYLSEQLNIQKKELIRLPYSIQSLSELFGVSRPSLSRSFSRLVDEGLIERKGRRIRIIDPDLLHQCCVE